MRKSLGRPAAGAWGGPARQGGLWLATYNMGLVDSMTDPGVWQGSTVLPCHPGVRQGRSAQVQAARRLGHQGKAPALREEAAPPLLRVADESQLECSFGLSYPFAHTCACVRACVCDSFR
jgi:hypothetical protein